MTVRPAKTQISINLGIRPVWSESSLCAQWIAKTQAKTLIRLDGCPGWSESSLGAHATLLVLSWDGSIVIEILCDKNGMTNLHSETTIYTLISYLTIQNAYVYSYGHVYNRNNFVIRAGSSRDDVINVSYIPTVSAPQVSWMTLETEVPSPEPCG